MTKHFSTSSFFVFHKDLNYGDSLFGGRLMSEIDCEAAKVARSLIYGTESDHVAVVLFENIKFKAPAKLGDIVIIEADITSLGTTSIKIKINGWCKRGDRKDWVEICEANSIFVSLKNGEPYPHKKSFEEILIN